MMRSVEIIQKRKVVGYGPHLLHVEMRGGQRRGVERRRKESARKATSTSTASSTRTHKRTHLIRKRPQHGLIYVFHARLGRSKAEVVLVVP